MKVKYYEPFGQIPEVKLMRKMFFLWILSSDFREDSFDSDRSDGWTLVPVSRGIIG